MVISSTGGNNFNQNLENVLGNGPGKIHGKSAEKTGTTENGTSVKASSSRFSGIKKFFRNVGHVGHRVMREVRKNQGKDIQGEGISSTKGFKRAYAQLFKKNINVEEANKLVKHLLNGDDKLLKDATPSLGKQLVKILQQNPPEGLTEKDVNIFKIKNAGGQAIHINATQLSEDKENYLDLLSNTENLLRAKGNYEKYKDTLNLLKAKKV